MALLGAHMSIAGGYYKAVEAAHSAGCDCVQLFTKNNNQWYAKPISSADVERFQGALANLGVGRPIAHNSYLINLASPDGALWKKSIDAMVVEVSRAGQLGIACVVAHPGAYTTSSEELGILRVAQALDEIHGQTRGASTKILLETTAGQGSNLGWRFEQIAQILGKVRSADRLGVCFDTCHVFAAGYPMGTKKEYQATMRQFNQTVGVNRIEAFHLNDSKTPCGSRVDRHDHIGRGHMGLAPFQLLLADRRFKKIPMYLETPKGQERGKDLDAVNLSTLRRLIG